MTSSRNLGRIIKLFTREMPLDELADYNAYWERRSDAASDKPPVLRNRNHRKIILSRELEDGKTLLDVGCGNCSFFDLLKQKRNIDMTGLDISEKAAEIGREKGYKVILKDLQKERLEGQYDYITALNVLEHIVDAETIVRNVMDSFHEYLIISVPNIGALTHRIRLGLFGRMPLTSVWYHIKEHVRFWTVRDFHHWADHLGLRVVKQFGVSAGGKWKNISPSLFYTNVMYFLKRK